MWGITLEDLRFRRRRFATAIVGTALVFAMALVMSGMSAGFRVEADRVLSAVGADAWVVNEGLAGPFTAFGTIPEERVGEVGAADGVREAAPLIVLRHTLHEDGGFTDVNAVGFRVGSLGQPPVASGRAPQRPGEVLADRDLGYAVGDTLTMQDRGFTVVGETSGLTYFGGIPAVFMPLADAQRLAFGGERFVTAIVTRGVPASAPAGMAVLTNEMARADMLRPLKDGIQAIDSVRILCWLVAATIIGAVVYLSALERVRDFAVLKAVGAGSFSLFAGLAVQAVLVSMTAAVIGLGLSQVLGPTFALPIEIPSGAMLLLPVVALVVGLVASLSGLRRAVGVDPARAFGAG